MVADNQVQLAVQFLEYLLRRFPFCNTEVPQDIYRIPRGHLLVPPRNHVLVHFRVAGEAPIIHLSTDSVMVEMAISDVHYSGWRNLQRLDKGFNPYPKLKNFILVKAQPGDYRGILLDHPIVVSAAGMWALGLLSRCLSFYRLCIA